jgi:hypothetical protein
MKVYHQDLIDQIKSLRALGNSYADIQTALGVTIPKSSMSYICRGTLLPDEYIQELKLARQNRLVGARELALIKNKDLLAERIHTLEIAADKNVNSTDREYFIALAMLYWAEGGKWPNRSGLYFASSDPIMLKTYIFLIAKCYRISLDKLHARVQIRHDQSDKDCIEYWSEMLGISKSNFYPVYRDLRTKGKPTKRVGYRGVCGVTCAGADIQIELQKMTGIITESWGISSVG